MSVRPWHSRHRRAYLKKKKLKMYSFLKRAALEKMEREEK